MVSAAVVVYDDKCAHKKGLVMELPKKTLTTIVPVQEYKYGSALLACRFDPTGRYLFIAAQNNAIERINLNTGERTDFTEHESWVRSIILDCDEKELDEKLARKERALVPVRGFSGVGAAALAAPEPGRVSVITADYHGTMIYWRAGRELITTRTSKESHKGWIRALALSPDGTRIASCGNDNLVKLWNREGRLLHLFEGHQSHVYNLAFHPEGTQLVSGDLRGIIKVWDLQDKKLLRELDAKVLYKYDPTFRAEIGGVRAIAFDPKGKFLACAGITNVSNAFAGVGNPAVLLYEWQSGKAKQLKPKDAFQGTAWGIAFCNESTLIAAGGGSQGRIWVWNYQDESNVLTVNIPVLVRDLCFHNESRLLAIACSDGSARIFRLNP